MLITSVIISLIQLSFHRSCKTLFYNCHRSSHLPSDHMTESLFITEIIKRHFIMSTHIAEHLFCIL